MNQSIQNEKPKSRKTLLVIIVIAIVALICCAIISLLAAFFFFSTSRVSTSNTPVVENVTASNNTTNTNSTSNSTTSNTTNSTTNNTQSNTKNFIGAYVMAIIPSNWSIKEYTDKSGMYAYADSSSLNASITGLTGFDVLDENNNMVFNIKGADGIGGSGGCATVGEFSDTQASYIQSVKDETDALGFTPTTVVDLTNADFTAISSLNQRFRRVGNTLYVADKTTSTSVFNPLCGISEKFIRLDEYNFTIKDSGQNPYTSNVYHFGINSAVTDEPTLTKLDEVLNTIKAKNIS